MNKLHASLAELSIYWVIKIFLKMCYTARIAGLL